MDTLKKRPRRKKPQPIPWLQLPPKPERKRDIIHCPVGCIPYTGPYAVRYPKVVSSKRPLKERIPPPPSPTEEMVDKFAIEMARENNIVNKNLLRLITWRPGVDISDIPVRTIIKHLLAAQTHWGNASVLLKRSIEENHALLLRRLRRCGHRERTRFWTKAPLRHGQTPPPRRRSYVPPIILEKHAHAPPGASPPGGREHDPAESPEARDRELLLFCPGGGHRLGALRKRSLWNPLHKCGTTLFDNCI